jgi:hypothetical protein
MVARCKDLVLTGVEGHTGALLALKDRSVFLEEQGHRFDTKKHSIEVLGTQKKAPRCCTFLVMNSNSSFFNTSLIDSIFKNLRLLTIGYSRDDLPHHLLHLHLHLQLWQQIFL